MATKKKAAKKTSSKKAGGNKSARSKAAKKSGKNKLGVKNSLVNNINARKKKGISRKKRKTTIDKKQYDKMEGGWGKKK